MGSFWWWLFFVVVVVVVVVVFFFRLMWSFFCVAFVVWLMGCFALGNSKNPYRKFQDEIANCFETKFLVDYL